MRRCFRSHTLQGYPPDQSCADSAPTGRPPPENGQKQRGCSVGSAYTFPQEKHRTGMIIVDGAVVFPIGDLDTRCLWIELKTNAVVQRRGGRERGGACGI